MELNTEGQCDSDVSDSWSVVDYMGDDTNELTGMDKDKAAFQIVGSEPIDECFELTEMTPLDDPVTPDPSQEKPKILPSTQDSDTGDESDGISIINEDEDFGSWQQIAHENYNSTMRGLNTSSLSPFNSPAPPEYTAEPESHIVDESTTPSTSVHEVKTENQPAAEDTNAIGEPTTNLAGKDALPDNPAKYEIYSSSSDDETDNDTFGDDSESEYDRIEPVRRIEPSWWIKILRFVLIDVWDDPEEVERLSIEELNLRDERVKEATDLSFKCGILPAVIPFIIWIAFTNIQGDQLQQDNNHLKSPLSASSRPLTRPFAADLTDEFPCMSGPASSYLQSREGLICCLQELSEYTHGHLRDSVTSFLEVLTSIPKKHQAGMKNVEKNIAKNVEILLAGLDEAQLVSHRFMLLSFDFLLIKSTMTGRNSKEVLWHPQALDFIPEEPEDTRETDPRGKPRPRHKKFVANITSAPRATEKVPENTKPPEEPVLKDPLVPGEPEDTRETDLRETPRPRHKKFVVNIASTPPATEKVPENTKPPEESVLKDPLVLPDDNTVKTEETSRLIENNPPENIASSAKVSPSSEKKPVDSQKKMEPPLHKKNKRRTKRNKSSPTEVHQSDKPSKLEKSNEPKQKYQKVKVGQEDKTRNQEIKKEKENKRKECPKKPKSGHLGPDNKCSNITGEWFLKRGKSRQTLRDDVKDDVKATWYIKRILKSRNI